MSTKTKTQLSGAVILKVLTIVRPNGFTGFGLAGAFKEMETEWKITFYDLHELTDEGGDVLWSSHELWDDLTRLKQMELITIHDGVATITEGGVRRTRHLTLADEIKHVPQILLASLGVDLIVSVKGEIARIVDFIENDEIKGTFSHGEILGEVLDRLRQLQKVWC